MTARLVTWGAQIGGDATVYEAAQQMLEGLYRKAVGEAYRKRHSMRWVALDSATHGLLAESVQRLREQTWLDSDDMFQAAVSDPRSERLPDGTAPPLATICGLPVRIDDTIEGIEWDTGPELHSLTAKLLAEGF